MDSPELQTVYIAGIWAIAAALLGVILGFLLDTIKLMILKPKLRIYYDHSSVNGDAMKLPLIDRQTGLHAQNGWAYYFRLRVKNEGRVAAKSVEVYAASLEEETIGGQFERRTFIPLNLAWSHGTKLHVAEHRMIYFPSISPQMEKHCDLGHVYHPQRRPPERTSNLRIGPGEADFQFDLVVEPSSLSDVITKGKYYLKVIVAAVDAKPREVVFKISFAGKWYDDELEMFKHGVVIELLKK